MFSRLAPFYDLLKSHRNYDAEADFVSKTIQARKGGSHVLEVACGTGNLLRELKQYERTGLDLSPEMLEVARSQLGECVTLHIGDLTSFDLDAAFDALICMDGAIGYIAPADLRVTFACFARHLHCGGLVIIEPWYDPSNWEAYAIRVTSHSDGDTTVARMSFGRPDGQVDFHNVIGTADGIHHFDETYHFYLHTLTDLHCHLERAGFRGIEHLRSPIFSRGLLVARKT